MLPSSATKHSPCQPATGAPARGATRSGPTTFDDEDARTGQAPGAPGDGDGWLRPYRAIHLRRERSGTGDRVPREQRQPPENGPTPASRGLTRRDFFADLVERLRMSLPAERATFRHRASSSLLKLDYGNERIHYEIWTDGQRGQIEIGLHFEDGPVSTAAYLAFFDRHIVELKHRLGPGVELERWTASWGHLFEIHPLGRLDRSTVERVAERLSALIVAAQPLVDAAAIPAERSTAPGEARGPWRSWRRGRTS